ncbi:MAG: GNAT family N-acetyltransferase [Coriobacteriales bacterium]
MDFIGIDAGDEQAIDELSVFASRIVKAHYDPIIGPEQNDYMIELFQSPRGIAEQIAQGSRYYLCLHGGQQAGYIAFYPKGDAMYLSKFYLDARFRGQGLSRQMLAFVEEAARAEGLAAIELNVNRNNPAVNAYIHLGFDVAAQVTADIGHGFIMDDYLMRKPLL